MPFPSFRAPLPVLAAAFLVAGAGTLQAGKPATHRMGCMVTNHSGHDVVLFATAVQPFQYWVLEPRHRFWFGHGAERESGPFPVREAFYLPLAHGNTVILDTDPDWDDRPFDATFKVFRRRDVDHYLSPELLAYGPGSADFGGLLQMTGLTSEQSRLALRYATGAPRLETSRAAVTPVTWFTGTDPEIAVRAENERAVVLVRR
ncbi:hypothetical protein [Mesoterricola sediminis]|uniref:Uncharacterized protein n=1 Tax=Mesoterricola sediminis TaxID=2927980 RepID=A0AA48GZJ4_9BACT|nr:hypothetical protein [Mesoterricola sediminis]BDU76922.1 hypothetical protein METESE_18800 [Mesoterricola sediminis]